MVNVALLHAVGVNGDGHREILGVELSTAEDGAGWLSFWRSLVARGLSGVQLVISDDHTGLVEAIRATLPGASWQRCRTHYMKNLLTKVPKAASQMVATMVRTIFAQPDPDSVWAQHRRVVDQLEGRLGLDAAAHLDEAAADLLAFTGFPKEHWRQIWSNNPQERLNREIRRRTDVVGIFPARSSVIRLVGAVMAEQDDEWAITRRYMSLESLAQARIRTLDQPDQDQRRWQHSKQPAKTNQQRPTRHHPYTTSLDVTKAAPAPFAGVPGGDTCSSGSPSTRTETKLPLPPRPPPSQAASAHVGSHQPRSQPPAGARRHRYPEHTLSNQAFTLSEASSNCVDSRYAEASSRASITPGAARPAGSPRSTFASSRIEKNCPSPSAMTTRSSLISDGANSRIRLNASSIPSGSKTPCRGHSTGER